MSKIRGEAIKPLLNLSSTGETLYFQLSTNSGTITIGPRKGNSNLRTAFQNPSINPHELSTTKINTNVQKKDNRKPVFLAIKCGTAFRG